MEPLNSTTRRQPEQFPDENAVADYIEKGLLRPMAEYFASGRKRITSVAPNDDFSLTLTFDNGDVRKYDMKPHLIPGTVFEFLMNLKDFRRVYLDEYHVVCWDIDPNVDSKKVWSNQVDLCPECCYVHSIPVEDPQGGKK